MFMPSISSNSLVTIDDPSVTLLGHTERIYSVVWSPDGSKVGTASGDDYAKIWNPETGENLYTFSGHSANVGSMDWCPTDNNKVVTGSNSAKVWDVNNGIVVSTYDPGDYVHPVVWSPDGSKIACGVGKEVKVWNASTGEELMSLPADSHRVVSVDWSPDGSKIVSSEYVFPNPSVIKIWDAATGSELHSYTPHSHGVKSVRWSPDGSLIASGSFDHSVKIWYPDNGTVILTWSKTLLWITSVAWSPDGSMIAISGNDDNPTDEHAKVIDAKTGDLLFNLMGHISEVTSIVWSPDGTKLLTGSSDNTAKIWDLSNYLNSPPTLPTFAIPTSIKLYRNDTITLSANSTDDKTSPSELTPNFQYKPHSDSTWSDHFISEPTFSSDEWHADFTPGTNATLGFYDLRVRFSDESGASSVWTTIENAVKVLNNPPEITWISPLSLTVHRGQDTSIDIEATDLEDAPENVPVHLEYSRADDIDWKSDIFPAPIYNDSSDRWNVILSFPHSNPPGLHDIRMRCTDADGNSSIWNYLNDSVTLLNNPPRISGFSVNPSELFRGRSSIIYVEASDPENGTDLSPPVIETKSVTSSWRTIESTYNHIGDNFSAVYETNGTMGTGEHSFRARSTDNEDTTCNWYYFNDTLTVKNNPPSINESFTNISVYNDRNTVVDLITHASDYENLPFELTWKVIEYSPLTLFDAYMKNSTAVEIWPGSSERSGLGKIEFRITDKDGGEVLKNITVEILNGSERPDISVVLQSPGNNSIVGNNTINLTWLLQGHEGYVRYDVYFGDSPENMTLKLDKHRKTQAEITGLIDGKTYYWKVTAEIFGIPGVFESEIYNFKVQLGFTPIHEIEVSFDTPSVSVKRGDSVIVTLTFRNLGNVDEAVDIKVLGDLAGSVSKDERMELATGAEKKMNITIFAGSRLELRTYQLTVEAVFSGERTTAIMDVAVTEDTKTDGDRGGLASWMWFAIAAVLVLAIAGLLIFIILRRRKRTDDEGEVIEAEIEGRSRSGITKDDLDMLSIGGAPPPESASFQGRLSYTLPAQQQVYQHKPLPTAPQVTLPELKVTGAVKEEPKALPQTTGAPPAVTAKPIPTVSLPQGPEKTPGDVPALPSAGTIPPSPSTPTEAEPEPIPVPTKAVPAVRVEPVPASIPPTPTVPAEPLPPPESGAPPPPPQPESVRTKLSYLSVKNATTFRIEEPMPCSICYGDISGGLLAARCSCGDISHLSCGIKIGKCTQCGVDYQGMINTVPQEAIIESVEDSRKPAKRDVEITVEWDEKDDMMRTLLRQLLNKEITVEQYQQISNDIKETF